MGLHLFKTEFFCNTANAFPTLLINLICLWWIKNIFLIKKDSDKTIYKIMNMEHLQQSVAHNTISPADAE